MALPKAMAQAAAEAQAAKEAQAKQLMEARARAMEAAKGHGNSAWVLLGPVQC